MEINQRIYKEYIGNREELIKLKKWFMLFHYVLICILDKKQNQVYINDKLKVLKIEYEFEKNIILFEKIDTQRMQRIYSDFIKQFSTIEKTNYTNFNDLENSKLVLFNIVETYMSYLKNYAINKESKLFFKQSINRAVNVIPKSKERKIFSRYVHNFNYYFTYFGMLSFWFILLFILVCFGIIKFLPMLNYLPTFILKSIISIDNIEKIIFYIIVYIAFIISSVASIIIMIKLDKVIRKRIAPERKIVFERDIFEQQRFLSKTSVGIAIISILISTVTILMNIYIK